MYNFNCNTNIKKKILRLGREEREIALEKDYAYSTRRSEKGWILKYSIRVFTSAFD